MWPQDTLWPHADMDRITKRKIVRLSAGQHEVIDDNLVVEELVTITLNGDKVLTAACSPGMLRELTYGHLLSEGMIRSLADVTSYHRDEGTIVVQAVRHEEKQGPVPIDSSFSLPPNAILLAARRAHERGEIFQLTGGTHAAAVCALTDDMIFVEDISRTCALEKAIGQAFLSQVDLAERFVFLSSRVQSSMLEKIARCGISLVGCVSAPTAEAVDLADRLGVCLCGFVRGDRLNIYSHRERIVL